VAEGWPVATNGRDADYVGSLDMPAMGEAGKGDVLRVAGWALLGGHAPTTVDVSVEGAGLARARTQMPRPDVAAALPHLAEAGVSGYEARIAVDVPPGSSRTLSVRVRVRSGRGQEWISPIRFCTLHNPATDEADLRLADRLEADTARLLDGLTSAGTRDRSVVVFTHSLAVGGGQLWLQELLQGLVRDRGWRATVVSPVDGPVRVDCEDLGVPVHLTTHYRVDSLAGYEGHVAELALLTRATGASVALVNTLGAFPAVDAALRAGVPTAWALHESFSLSDFSFLNWGAAGLPPVLRGRWERALRQADRLLFVADATREMYLPMSRPSRCATIRYGTPMIGLGGQVRPQDRRRARAALGIPADATMLLNVGVLEPRKGQGPLVAAIDRIRARHPDVHLAMVGSHPTAYAQAVERYVTEAGLDDRVRIVPIVRDPQDWFMAADLFVNSSDIESLPRSILEAVCCGLPVLATDVFGAREMITDGESGWLFEPNDGGALVTALLRALDTPRDERAAMARTAWQRLQPWLDPATYVRDYDRELSLLANPRTSR
jgi:D-inositol-3-phosphate glycosyltransferase